MTAIMDLTKGTRVRCLTTREVGVLESNPRQESLDNLSLGLMAFVTDEVDTAMVKTDKIKKVSISDLEIVSLPKYYFFKLTQGLARLLKTS